MSVLLCTLLRRPGHKNAHSHAHSCSFDFATFGRNKKSESRKLHSNTIVAPGKASSCCRGFVVYPSWFLKARFCYTTPFLVLSTTNFRNSLSMRSGLLYNISCTCLAALRTRCGGRKTLHSVASPLGASTPVLFGVTFHLSFTHRGYRPFSIEASLSLGLQGFHTKVLLALLH